MTRTFEPHPPRDTDADRAVAQASTDWRADADAAIRNIPASHNPGFEQIMRTVNARREVSAGPAISKPRQGVTVEQIMAVADTGKPISYVNEALPCAVSTARTKLKKVGRLKEYHERQRAALRRADGGGHDV